MNAFINFFKQKKIIYSLAIIVLIIGGYYWYSKNNSATTDVQYKTAVAEKGNLITSVSGSGNIIVDNSANIDPTITGTVTNLAVSVGDKVKKGQLLFEIENDDLGVNVTKAYSAYLQALQSLETAKASKQSAHLAVLDDATGKTILSYQRKYEAAKLGLSAAEENVKSALENYQNAQEDYADRKVIASIAGTVNAINIKNGDDLSKLSSGSSREVPIIIGDLNTMKAYVEVSEVDIVNVILEQKVNLTFNAIDNFTLTGKVEKMDALGTDSDGVVSYNVTISLDSLDAKIKPGMTVSAAIITNTKENVILIPNNAVKTENGTYYAEVKTKEGVFERRNIKVGLEGNSKTEVASGLAVGDVVVSQATGVTNTSTSTTKSATSSSSRGGGGGMGIPGM
jgi:RND family efflux transporter MFP subunit